jgi:hypothetical protein
MKQSINFSQFVDAFNAYDRYSNYGYDGLRIIFDYFEEFEDSTGEEIELDVIGICCDVNMMEFDDVISDYGLDDSDCEDDDERQELVRDYLNEKTSVLGETGDNILFFAF